MPPAPKPPFHSIFLDRKAPRGAKNKQLVFWGKILSDLDPTLRAPGQASLSYRHLNGCVITVANADMRSLTEESFVEIYDAQKTSSADAALYCKGTREPSLDALVHFLIYKERRDVQAIIFGHDELVLDKLAKLRIAKTAQEEERGTPALFKRIKDVLGRRKYVYVKNRGILAFGRTIQEAGKRTLLVHELAMKKP